MQKIKILPLILLTLVLAGCQRDFSTDFSQPPFREATVLEKSLSQADNTFGFRLFQQLQTETGDSNLFISPFSVSMALGMTLNGAAGGTEEAMKTTLGLENMSQDEINATYQSLRELLACQDSKVLMEIANSIWYREGYPVLPSFIDVNRSFFDAMIREMDFSSPGALPAINGWISEKTHDKINNALDQIPPDVVMYLINAIYFKGMWMYEFDPEKTYETTFATPGGTVSCQMMRQSATYRYYQNPDFQAVDLPYGDGQFSMTVFLPAPGHSADALIEQMNDEVWQEWIAQFDSVNLVLGLPRFKVEYGTLLNDALTAMGMGVAFSGGADFTGINPGAELYISRVIHKTFVEVNEEGTEAAAVTIVELRETSAGEMSMILNRPFVFMIWDHNSGSILFMGKIVEPGRT